MTKSKIVTIKKNFLNKKPVRVSQDFPKFPVLYLELLENKSKIKPELKNVSYKPHYTKEEEHKMPDERKIQDEMKESVDDRSVDDMSVDDRSVDDSSGDDRSRDDRSGDDRSRDDRSKDDRSVDEYVEEEEINEDDITQLFTDKYKKASSVRYTSSRNASSPSSYNYSSRAPSLVSLQDKGVFNDSNNMRNLNMEVNSRDVEDKKRELMFKFELLKKSYPNSSIQEFTLHSDLHTMQRSYDDSIRRLSLDSTVENYKQYLIYGFMFTEFVFGNFLKFDMQGFTQQQLKSMNSYEKLLIELGEKSYVPTGSSWPVELRLLFMVIMNAAFFIVSKMIAKKTGSDIMNMMNKMNVSSPTNSGRKMQGPKFNRAEL